MKHIIISLFAGLFLMLASCQENDLETWHGEDGVYFYVQWGAAHLDSAAMAVQPYTRVEFVQEGRDTVQVKMRVMLAGEIKDYDRHFRLVIDQDSTTAVADENFIVPEETQTIRAGEYYTDIYATVMTSKALEDEELRVGFRLLPTAELTLACPVWEDLGGMYANSANLEEFDGALHLVYMNDFLTRPAGWTQANTDPEVGDQEVGLLGFFSREKFDYILSVLPDLTYEDFASTTTMPMARQRSIAYRVAQELTAANTAGNPVLEADGRRMWVTGCGWTSYYGVPYNQ